MNDSAANQGEGMGDLVKAYIRARTGLTVDPAVATRVGQAMGKNLRDRIDVLGNDAERLLDVGSQNVIATLIGLESEALFEDSGNLPTLHSTRQR